MREDAPLASGGRISAGGLLGHPDLLRRSGNGYVASDIKSGSGLESTDEDTPGRPKKYYGVQLAFYSDILQKLGFAAKDAPFIWDVHGEEVPCDPMAEVSRGVTLRGCYRNALDEAASIVTRSVQTRPALGAACKLCHWRFHCRGILHALDDLSLIPLLGRARRDVMLPLIPTVHHLAAAECEQFIRGKRTVFPGIGAGTLRTFHDRAVLLVTPGSPPCLKAPVVLPDAEIELFFDVETDPMVDMCYLHGFLERIGGRTGIERYVAFMVEEATGDEERRCFAEAWDYVRCCQPCANYYYSPMRGRNVGISRRDSRRSHPPRRLRPYSPPR